MEPYNQEFLDRLDEAHRLITDLYHEWSSDKLLPLMRDHELQMNLIQLYLQTWYLHYLSQNNPQAAAAYVMVSTQACFIIGYMAGRESREVEDTIPESIKNLDISGIL